MCLDWSSVQRIDSGANFIQAVVCSIYLVVWYWIYFICALSQSHCEPEIYWKKTLVKDMLASQSSLYSWLYRVLQCRVLLWTYFSLLSLGLIILHLSSCSFREDSKPDLADPFHNTFNFELTPFSIFKRGVTMEFKCSLFPGARLLAQNMNSRFPLNMLNSRSTRVGRNLHSLKCNWPNCHFTSVICWSILILCSGKIWNSLTFNCLWEQLTLRNSQKEPRKHILETSVSDPHSVTQLDFLISRL